MRMIVRFAAAGVALVLAGASLAAQGAPIAGRWEIEYVRGVRVENGEHTNIQGRATLAIEAHGDSLTAVLTSLDADDGPAQPPERFTGRLTPDGAVFEVKGQVRINLDGNIETRDVLTTWTLAAHADVLDGSLSREIKNSPMPNEPRPVSGRRVK